MIFQIHQVNGIIVRLQQWKTFPACVWYFGFQGKEHKQLNWDTSMKLLYAISVTFCLHMYVYIYCLKQLFKARGNCDCHLPQKSEAMCVEQISLLCSLTVKKNMKYVEDLNTEFAKGLHGMEL